MQHWNRLILFYSCTNIIFVWSVFYPICRIVRVGHCVMNWFIESLPYEWIAQRRLLFLFISICLSPRSVSLPRVLAGRDHRTTVVTAKLIPWQIKGSNRARSDFAQSHVESSDGGDVTLAGLFLCWFLSLFTSDAAAKFENVHQLPDCLHSCACVREKYCRFELTGIFCSYIRVF